MNKRKQKILLAEAGGWRRWQFGDPFLEGLKLADQKFNGYIRTVTRVYSHGLTLDVDESPIYSFDTIKKEYIPTNFWLSPTQNWWPVLPNYPENLNAVYDAIQEIIVRGPTIQEFRSNEHLFQEQLDLICDREQVPVWHFTAELYCEALLKTLGKWENEKTITVYGDFYN